MSSETNFALFFLSESDIERAKFDKINTQNEFDVNCTWYHAAKPREKYNNENKSALLVEDGKSCHQSEFHNFHTEQITNTIDTHTMTTLIKRGKQYKLIRFFANDYRKMIFALLKNYFTFVQ